MRRFFLLLLAIAFFAIAVSLISNRSVINALANRKTARTINAPALPPIIKISICRPNNPSGTLQPGSCVQGFDTHQLVLGKKFPNSTVGPVPINESKLGVGPVPDEHACVYPP